MASTRPKRNNSPINTKHQPLKATVPFQSLIRNPGSPTAARRRTSPCSPIIPPDKSRVNRKSPDLAEQPRTLLSPLGNKPAPITTAAFSPVPPLAKAGSLEILSSSYINGQWPREQNGNGSMVLGLNTRGTQTVGNWEDPLSEDIIQLSLDQKRQPLVNNSNTTPTSVASPGGSKEIFRHHLKRTKQQSSQPCQSKQSCLQGDHFAVVSLSYDVSSKPMSIPQAPSSPKYPNLHTRRSVEGLDFELEGLDLARKGYIFAQTPPEGRRPPVPGTLCGRNFDSHHTQTSNGWVDTFSPTGGAKRSHSLSPSWLSPEKENTSPNRCLSADITMAELDSINSNKISSSSLVPKYAASPKPNNSFWFARGPPDGAEKIPLSNTDDVAENSEGKSLSSCPDTSKVTIQFSKDSPFCSFLDSTKMKTTS